MSNCSPFSMKIVIDYWRTDHFVDGPFHSWRPCIPCGRSTHLELSPITRYVGFVTAHFQAPTQDRFVHQKLSWLCCTCLTSVPSTMTRIAIFLLTLCHFNQFVDDDDDDDDDDCFVAVRTLWSLLPVVLLTCLTENKQHSTCLRALKHWYISNMFNI